MVERLVIARLGHRGDGIADSPEGPIYVAGALPGEIVEAESVARPSRPTAIAERRAAERGAYRADLSAFRRLRRLRAAALAKCAVSRVETQPRGRCATASRPRRAGRRSHRRARRGPPPRGVSRPARHPRCAGSRILGGARASHHFHRPLSGAGQKPRRRAHGRMGDRRGARRDGKAARHRGNRDRRRPRYRRARLGPSQTLH